MQTGANLAAIFGGDSIWIVIAWILGVCAIIISIGGAAKTIGDIKKGGSKRLEVLESLAECNRKDLQKYGDRIDKLEAKQKDSESGQKVLIKGMVALLEHGINGNNIDQLRQEKANMNDYLTR